MGFIRVEKNKNYVVMNKTALRDDSLSWKAKGIIAYMLSMPDDWKFYIDELTKHSTDGVSSFRSGLRELKEKGYVKRFPIRNDQNKIIEWETVVSEIPHAEKPVDGKPLNGIPQVENLHVENRTLLSTDELSTDSLNTDKPSNDVPYVEVINHLNDVAGTKYKSSTKKTQSLIRARFEEGFTLNDFKRVIDIKTNEWRNDPKMKKFIRPETLFSPKFEGYLNQEANEQIDNGQFDNLF